MEVDVLNIEGEKVSTVDLPDAIFGAPIRIDLMHQAVVRQLANARLGTHDTKTRGEVSGGGRKPFREKGTGRARQGSIRAPQWVGGGKVHTPHPRSYEMDMPRKMRRAALRSALSAKQAEAAIVVVDGLPFSEPKTRRMAESVGKLAGDRSALLLIDRKEGNENVVLSARNLAMTKVLLADYLNVRDLFSFDKVILPLAALEVIKSNLGGE
jgi:large subunit ribosomal protein L4